MTVLEVVGAAWRAIGYTDNGEAQVAECQYRDRRLIVRRTRLTEAAQVALWPNWRHFAFLTSSATRSSSTPSSVNTPWSSS